jgi:hypothetical protein
MLILTPLVIERGETDNKVQETKKGTLYRICQKPALGGRINGQPESLCSWTAGAVWWPQNIGGPSICLSSTTSLFFMCQKYCRLLI